MKIARNLVRPVYGVSVFQFCVWLFIPASENLAERDMGAPWKWPEAGSLGVCPSFCILLTGRKNVLQFVGRIVACKSVPRSDNGRPTPSVRYCA